MGAFSLIVVVNLLNRLIWLALIGFERTEMTYQFYRKTTLGNCLQDALDELYQQKLITPGIVTEVLNQYDRAIGKVLNHNVRSKLAVKGDLHTYRFCDNVWTFILNNAEFTDSADV